MCDRACPRVMVLTDRRQVPDGDLLPVVAGVGAAGADAVLLREKDLPRGERATLARSVAEAIAGRSRLILATDVDLAIEVGADGVHLAADDPWPEHGHGLLVGRSCHNRDELDAALGQADYVTLSPLWETPSKPGHGPALGVEGLRAACREFPDLPILALGGLTAERARRCIHAGAAGVAVMGEVMRSPDPGAQVAALLAEVRVCGLVCRGGVRMGGMATPPVALTIAGSDSGGGAGIQADLLTFAAHGVHGASVLTALTAQNTVGVDSVHVPPVEFLRAQLDSVLSDLPVAATKTGMLATEAVVTTVAVDAAAGRLPNLVVDPVLVSSTGARLLDEGAERAYLHYLFPHALVVTPNRREAGVLLGREVVTDDDAVGAAVDLGRYGPRWVVVKGGDPATGGEVGATDRAEALDVLVDVEHGDVYHLRAPWVATANDHGTGCTFASATAARLAGGTGVREALESAKQFVHQGLESSVDWKLGGGHGPVGKLGAWSS